jgi:hypothetical protein
MAGQGAETKTEGAVRVSVDTGAATLAAAVTAAAAAGDEAARGLESDW